jgi:hypothetical protein
VNVSGVSAFGSKLHYRLRTGNCCFSSTTEVGTISVIYELLNYFGQTLFAPDLSWRSSNLTRDTHCLHLISLEDLPTSRGTHTICTWSLLKIFQPHAGHTLFAPDLSWRSSNLTWDTHYLHLISLEDLPTSRGTHTICTWSLLKIFQPHAGHTLFAPDLSWRSSNLTRAADWLLTTSYFYKGFFTLTNWDTKINVN